MKKFTFLFRAASLMLLFSIFGSNYVNARESIYDVFIPVDPPKPTLASVTIEPVCVGQKANVVLSGLIAGAATAKYTINGVPGTVSGTATPGGTFTFTTGNLPLSYNNLVLSITEIKMTDTEAATTFSDKIAYFVVNKFPTLTGVTVDVACEGTTTTVRLSGLLPGEVGTATYTVGNQTGTKTGQADGNGNFSFTTGNLPLSDNNKVLEILSIMNASGCEASFSNISTNLIVKPRPTLTGVTAVAVCAGTSTNVVLSGLIPMSFGTATYKFGSQAPQTLSGTADSNGKFTFPTGLLQASDNGKIIEIIKIVNANECETTFTNKKVTLVVNALPVVTASNNGPVCTDSNVSLSAEGVGTFSWSGPQSFTSDVQNPSFVGTVEASGIYTVTITDVNGCKNTSSTQAIVNPLPDAQISGTALICDGGSFNLTASGGTSYAWSGPVGSKNGVLTTKFTSSNSNISNTISGLTQFHRIGDYTVTVTDANGCKNTATKTVGVNPVLSLNVIPVLAPVCAGSDFTINSVATISTVTKRNSFPYYTVTPGNLNDVTYSWTGPDNYASNASNAFVTALNSGSYSLEVTGPEGCVKSKSINVTVKALPTIELAETASVCEGSNVTLSASSNGTILSWFRNGNFLKFGSTLTITNAGLADAGIYTFRSRNNSLCTSEKEIALTVNALPVVTASNNGPVCTDSNVSLSAEGVGTFSWSGPQSFTSDVQNPSFVGTVEASGIYTVTITDVNGCKNTSSTEAIVNPLPDAQISGTALICDGGSFNLTASGGTSYAWSGPVGSKNGVLTTKFTSSNSNISNTISGLTQFHRIGDYTVTVTDANGCKNTATKTVGVNPVLSLNVIPVLAPVCAGSDFTINSVATISTVTKRNSFPYYTVTPGNLNDVTYSWTGPDNYASNASNAFVTALNSGSYSLEVTGPEGCVKSKSINVTVKALPTIELAETASVCEGSDITLYASSNGTILSWFRNGSFLKFGSTLTITNAGLADAGIYTFRSRNNSLCTSEKEIALTVNALPVVTASNNGPVCTDSNVTLSAEGVGTFSWIGEQSFTSDVQNPSFVGTVEASGIYTVTITDVNGCKNTSSTQAIVNPLPDAQISGTALICDGGSFSLTASGGTSYAWSGPVGSKNGVLTTKFTSSNSNISNTISGLTQFHRIGDYTVTVTDANGCKNTATKTVGVNPVLSLNVIPVLAPVCAGSDFTINSVATISTVTKRNSFPYYTVTPGNLNDVTYSWTGPDNYASNASNAFVTALNSGSYSLEITGPEGCVKSKSINVTVKALPTIELAETASVCEGSDITLYASSNGTILSWFRNGSFLKFGSTLTITNAGLADAGTYTFRARNNSLCTSEDTIELTVNQKPTLGAVTTVATCVNSGAAITLTGLLPGVSAVATYTINNGAPKTQSGTANENGEYTFTTQVTAAANGYTVEIVKLVNDGTLCETTFSGKTVNLIVNSSPTLLAVSSLPICENNAATIVLTGLNPGIAATATYTINSGTPQYQVGTPDVNGKFSFATGSLPTSFNNSVIKITEIVNSVSLCSTAFNKEVVLHVNALPTLESVEAAPFVAGHATYVVLKGLNHNQAAVATYTVNGGPSQFQGGVSNDNGEFSFSTGNLLAAANGMIIKITKIVNDGSLCETSFNNKQVTLQLATVNTKDIAPVGKFGSENNANVEFVLYPNPVNDILNIQSALDIKSVEILNINGQKVLSSKQKQINVSHLPAGMYMVRIQDVDNNTATKKIIIK